MLTRNEFSVLTALRTFEDDCTQREIAEATGLSLGSVNLAVTSLRNRNLLDGYALTEAASSALEPYRVDNAIIMAAGLSSRFAPISYEKPKGVLKVCGEVLLERQIRQLREAGIEDITVVVGYMKEEFFYLADKFGVHIVVNPLYAQRNNNYTLYLVREKLGNTYICSSDDYFTENVFESYVYEGYYAATYTDEPTDEYVLTTGSHDLITKVHTKGAPRGWFMLGHVYFDRTFSSAFVQLLEDLVEKPDTFGKLWEDIYAEHVSGLHLSMRRYDTDIIHEFDSLEDLRDFDPQFIQNVDSDILDNISSTLDCERNQIANIVPIKQGLTNMSFKFDVDGQRYVYRHPGAGTEAIISRSAEAKAEQIARKLDLDSTFVFEDEDRGWKISHFIEGCVPLDYHDDAQVKRAISMIRALHEHGEAIDASFDLFEKAQEIIEMLSERSRTSFADFDAIKSSISEIYDLVAADGVPACLCHNDFYDPNILVHGEDMYLIDWEYAGMGDYASDLGTFICCSDYTPEQAKQVIEWYFGKPVSPKDMRHCIAYVALAAFYWYVWAIYKDVCGDPVGEYLYIWYRYAKDYGEMALEMYR